MIRFVGVAVVATKSLTALVQSNTIWTADQQNHMRDYPVCRIKYQHILEYASLNVPTLCT